MEHEADTGDVRVLHLFVEILEDWPLWIPGEGPIDPDTLPLSPRLRTDLLGWASFYNEAAHPDYLYPEERGSFDVAAFNRRGERLRRDVQAELGDAWRIDHIPLGRSHGMKLRRR